MLRTISDLPDDTLLTTEEAAAYLGLSPGWLERDRILPERLIPYVKVARRAVRYRVTDLRTYVARRVVEPGAVSD